MKKNLLKVVRKYTSENECTHGFIRFIELLLSVKWITKLTLMSLPRTRQKLLALDA